MLPDSSLSLSETIEALNHLKCLKLVFGFCRTITDTKCFSILISSISTQMDRWIFCDYLTTSGFISGPEAVYAQKSLLVFASLYLQPPVIMISPSTHLDPFV